MLGSQRDHHDGQAGDKRQEQPSAGPHWGGVFGGETLFVIHIVSFFFGLLGQTFVKVGFDVGLAASAGAVRRPKATAAMGDGDVTGSSKNLRTMTR